MTLPQMCFGLGRSLQIGLGLAQRIRPNRMMILGHIDDGTGLIHAKTLSFRSARTQPPPLAKAEVKALCKRVISGNGSLPKQAAAS